MDHLCLSCYNKTFRTHLHHRNCALFSSTCPLCGQKKQVIDHLKPSGKLRYTLLNIFGRNQYPD